MRPEWKKKRGKGKEGTRGNNKKSENFFNKRKSLVT
jgi:hypothetical protein